MTPQISSPTEFFGHEMGADCKLERWDRIVEYFRHIDASPCVKVVDLGKSTEGNPFLLAIITSEENHARLDDIREMSWKMAHPEGLTEEQVDEIAREGKACLLYTSPSPRD